MRAFSKMRPSIWSEKEFAGLPSAQHQLQDLYLRTNRHLNSAGVAFMPSEYGAADMRCTPTEFADRLSDLVLAGRVMADSDTQEMWVVAWFEDNPPMNDAHYQGTQKLISAINSPAIRASASEALEKAWGNSPSNKSNRVSVLRPPPIQRRVQR